MGTDITALRKAFEQAIASETKNLEKAAVLFSAGLDSSLIAKAVSERIPQTELFAVGTKNSKDLAFAGDVAEEMGLKLNIRTIDESEISAYIEKTKQALGPELSKELLQLQIGVPQYIALEFVKKHNFDVVFSGQGGDELFCGYAGFKRILEEGGYPAVEKEIAHLLEIMPQRNLARESTLTKHFSIEQRTPFLDESFKREAMKIPAQEKILSPDDALRKHPLRALARELGVPEKACTRPKKAIQYGSGVAGLIGH
ncbi:MAG: asparagine synthase C-terminal domain-containing protein [Candidatus Diapherotrites archaeon]|nr:asparagine synthase C-terminal domain-containing protein [Candidatus Micrarchaeota archaeon]MBU1939676.1 asparagine synthase C-terminal domain-containing protein [Candidatus Micrarchaeota archaeon]